MLKSFYKSNDEEIFLFKFKMTFWETGGE